jgi:hypothetical protein
MRWYQKVCLVATMPVMLTACAIDVGKLAADMKKPSVTFESPESWSCDQQMKMGFQEHLPENVRLERMTDWPTVPSVVKTAA